ncbi:MAG: hypothetical protein LBF93_03305 [Zoogloeaceae bacterium]|jgi:hypothetical protein|nr:hypothetical protein [Zoogloeaceae bacterium]
MNTIPLLNGKTRTLHLDGRVPLDKITDKAKRARFHAWMKDSAESISVDPNVFSTLTGTIFEVRQGYKSKDSKRQNADIANAAAAYTKLIFHARLFCQHKSTVTSCSVTARKNGPSLLALGVQTIP